MVSILCICAHTAYINKMSYVISILLLSHMECYSISYILTDIDINHFLNSCIVQIHSNLLNPSLYWVFKLLPVLCYCKQCCSDHPYTCTFAHLSGWISWPRLLSQTVHASGFNTCQQIDLKEDSHFTISLRVSENVFYFKIPQHHILLIFCFTLPIW